MLVGEEVDKSSHVCGEFVESGVGGGGKVDESLKLVLHGEGFIGVLLLFWRHGKRDESTKWYSQIRDWQSPKN